MFTQIPMISKRYLNQCTSKTAYELNECSDFCGTNNQRAFDKRVSILSP